jgi:calcium-dependent protein kinase
MGCGSLKKYEKPSDKRSSIVLFPGQFVKSIEEDIHHLYEFREELGVGSYGRVVTGIHKKTRERRAIKIINKLAIHSDELRKKIMTEVEIQRKLDHPNIVKVFEFHEDEYNLYLVMELCTGGELLDSISRVNCLSEALTATYMKQILSALVYLHSLNIVHRDLKLENMLIEKPNSQVLKLADFGIATELKPGKFLSMLIGTMNYIAPEVVKRKYNNQCDLWSAGVIMFILLSGTLPFKSSSKKKTLALIAEGKFSLDVGRWELVSNEAKNFLRKLLEVDVKMRYSASNALLDPWLMVAKAPEVRSSLLETTANNLKNFRETHKFQRAVIRYIASQLLSQKDKAEYISIFKSLDKTGTGKLTEEELIPYCKKIFGDSFTDEEIHSIMTRVDTDNSGYIDYSEFIAAAMDKKKLLSEEKLEATFKAFDRDHNGKITAQELKYFLESSIKIDISAYYRLIQQVDKNGDGEIDFQEFKEMMRALVSH